MNYLAMRQTRLVIMGTLILLSLMLTFSSVGAQDTSGLNISTDTINFYSSANQPITVAPDLVIEGSENITATSVSINAGFVSSEDQLLINGNTSGIIVGISYNYNSTTGVMTLTGEATAATYQQVLRQVAYYNSNTSNPDQTQREIAINLGSQLYSPVTGNYYEVVFTNQDITWVDAYNDANARTFFGLKGYLVTLTSEPEDTFVASKLEGVQGWMGASDDPAYHTNNPNGDKVWQWVNGPEQGQIFTYQYGYIENGTNLQGNGVLSAPAYENWRRSDCRSNEPNDYGDGDCPVKDATFTGGDDGLAGNEDYAHYLPNGTWNDYPNTRSIQAYIVEYGGSAGDPTVNLFDTINVNIEETDPTPPSIVTTNGYYPAPGDSQAPVSGNFRITFTEDVIPDSGTIKIYVDGNPTPVETIDITTVIFTGNNVFFTPTTPLSFETNYYIIVDNGAITDLSGNPFAGITDPNGWTFTTRPFNGGLALNPGDIAIVEYTVDNNGFSFVPMVDLPVGTVIKFTDNGWRIDDTFRPGEGIVTFEVTSTVPAGTVIDINNPNDFGITTTTGTFSLSPNGDQILVYQGTEEDPFFIYGISLNGEWQTDATDDNTSRLPGSLNIGTTAVELPEANNYGFVGITTGTRDEILTAIGFPGSWEGNENTPVDGPNRFTIIDISATDRSGPILVVDPFSPANGGTDVSITPTFTITFDEPVQTGTGGFTIYTTDGTPVETISIDDVTIGNGGTTITFSPTNPLSNSTTYYILVNDTAIVDGNGNRFGGISDPNTWRITTVSQGDVTAPTITSTSPTPDEANVSVNPSIVLSFSEPVTFSALPTFACQTNEGIEEIGGTVAASNGNQTYTGTPGRTLPENAACTLSIQTSSVTDAAGNTLQDTDSNPNTAYLLSFTTEILPRLTSANPANGASDVSISSNFELTFNEAVTPTVGGASFACQPGGQVVPLAVTIGSGNTVYTLDPNTALPRESTCSLSIPVTALVDADNNTLVDNDGTANGIVVYSFNTEAEPAPQILSTTPTDGATDVKVDVDIVVALTEFVSRSTTTVSCQSGAVDIEYLTFPDPANMQYTLDLQTPLPFGSECTMVVDLTNAVDGDNNRVLDTDGVDDGFYNLTFTTEAAPQILSTMPTHGEENVSVDTVIDITLNEFVDGPGTTLFCDGQRVFYDETYDSNTNLYELIPRTSLPYGATCRLRVIIDNTSDSDGNKLLDNDVNPGDGFYDLTFQTEPEPLPSIVSTTPEQSASGVAQNSTIVINTSEALTVTGQAGVPLTCNASPVTYKAAVTGTTQYTLTPNSLLPVGATCTLSIPTNAVADADNNFLQDTDGNANGAYELTFTVTGGAASPQAEAATVESAPVIEVAD